MATTTRTKRGSAVTEALNLNLAIAADLRSQVKMAHWNTVGEEFMQLHKLFDEQAAMLALHVDVLAERMRALQAVPQGTVRMAAATSTLPEFEDGEVGTMEAVRLILDRFVQYSESLQAAQKPCEEADDLATQDVFIELQREVDLNAYFLRSHLGSRGR